MEGINVVNHWFLGTSLHPPLLSFDDRSTQRSKKSVTEEGEVEVAKHLMRFIIIPLAHTRNYSHIQWVYVGV